MNVGKDLATAGAIRGTCMDMCPEKERYLRQARRRLTIYEIHPESDVGRIYHNYHANLCILIAK